MHWHKYGKWSEPKARQLLMGGARWTQMRICSVCNKTKLRWVDPT